MFFLECKNLRDREGSNLVYSKNTCFIQTMCDDEVVFTEYTVPILFSNEDEIQEISILIDEKIIECAKTYEIAKVDGKKIYFDSEVIYEYEESTVIEWNDTLPKESCILKIPKIPNLLGDGERVHISFSRQLFIKNDVGITLKFPTVVNLFEQQKVDVNSKYLLEIFNENVGRTCTVRYEKESVLCFEFIGKKIYLAPLV